MFSLVDGTDLRGCVKPPLRPPLRHRVRFSSVRDSKTLSMMVSIAPRVCRGLSHYWPESLLTVQQLLQRVIISILTSVCYHRTVQREVVWERDMVCEVQQMYLSKVMSRRSTNISCLQKRVLDLVHMYTHQVSARYDQSRRCHSHTIPCA